MLRRESPVARFVVMILLILALLLFGAKGLIDQLTERARRYAELRSDTRILADQLAASLALPIWNFDQPQLDKITDSALRDRETAAVVIRAGDASDPRGFRTFGLVRNDLGAPVPFTSGPLPQLAGTLTEERPIIADGQTVGTLQVYLTPHYVEQELNNLLFYQFATFIIFAIILGASLYFLLWRIVLRPLRLIEQYAGQVSTGGTANLSGRFRGELERLRASMEKMVDLLAARFGALQQNQAMLSAVLNSTPQCIFWKDLDSRYLGCNQPFAQIAGLAAPHQIVGKTDFDLPWPRSASELYRAVDRQVVTTGITQDHIIEAHYAANGDVLTVETTKVALFNAAGKVYGVLGVFEDITNRIMAERRIASQLHFEELVARVSTQLVGAGPENIHRILDQVLGDIAHLLDADRVILGRTDEATSEMVAAAQFRLTDPPFPPRLVISERYPELWRQLNADRLYHINSVGQLGPEYAVDLAHFAEIGIESLLGVPVRIDGHLRYMLSIATIGRRAAWSDETIAHIRVLAHVLATTALRCETELAIRSSEHQFRIFIEQAPVPIILVPSPDGSPIYFNPAFTRTFGFTQDDLKTPEDWWPLLYPDPKYRAARHAAWEQTVARARQTGDFQDSEENEMATKSGQSRFAQVRISLVEGYRMSFLNDVTDRRQAESALRLNQYAVDHNPVMIFRLDMDGRFLYVNDAACTQLGYSPAEILNLHLWDIAETISLNQWPARAARLREQWITSIESVCRAKTGKWFPVEIRIQYVEFSGDKHFFVYANDITDRKKSQEAQFAYTRRVQKLATELTRSEERQRREFATILHDEVGQNLFAATTQLLAMRSQPGGPIEQVEKALALLDQVTRDTRQLTFELCPPALYQLGLVPALQRLAEQFATRYSVACTVTGNTSGPTDLNARGLAYQTVRELLNNAAKHARAKSVTINAAEIDHQVQIQVADDGVGFDPTALPVGDGGFGLFHLRERIDLLGGTFTIDSAPNRGTRVQFTLPLHVSKPTE